MNDRDRLAADPVAEAFSGFPWATMTRTGEMRMPCECCRKHWLVDCPNCGHSMSQGADEIDEERLARALHEARINCWTDRDDVCVARHDEAAAAIAKAYREDTE